MGGVVSHMPEGVDFGTEIDSFEIKYVGSVPVKAPNGKDVCAAAVERLRSLKVKEKPVIVLVTTSGIYVIDAKTSDVLKEVSIKHVTFVSQDPTDQQLVSFFEHDAAVRLITCHTFRMAKDTHLLPVAINDAFKALKTGELPPDAGEGGKKMRRRTTSKKDALAASTARQVTVEKGNELERYEAELMGTVNVSSPKGDDVVDEAVERIVKLAAKPSVVYPVVFEKAFLLEDAKTTAPLQLCNIREITYAKSIKGEQLIFAYIIHDRRLDKMTCTALNLNPPEEGKPSLRRSIDQAQRAFVQALREKEAAKVAQKIMDGESVNKIEKQQQAESREQETGKIIGTYEASYIGTNIVPEAKGRDENTAAITDALAVVLKDKIVPEGTFVSVGTEGVKVIAALTHEVIMAFVLKDVVFTTVTGKGKNILAFIQKDDSLGLRNCHFFQCAGERAFDIAVSIGDAFKAFEAEQARSGGNPFAPYGERETPTGELFKKQVHRRDLLPIKAIGAGQFGQVYLAKQVVADGEGDEGGDRKKRAVKMLRGGASAADKEEFIAECTTMLDFDHENLVQLVGVAIQQRPWLMVIEFCTYGDLRNLLKGCKAKNIELKYEEQLNFTAQIARGMEYIASVGLIHMDLAARNVLVSAGNIAKVADFGLTRRLEEGKDYWQSKTVMKLPVKWCSIEALDDRLFSEGSDVWAFGIVMWEVMSYGAMPYGKLKTQEVQRKVREGLRLEQPKDCPDDYFAVCQTCWKSNRKDRPKFTTLCKELNTYLRTQSTGIARDIGATLKATNQK